MNEYFRLYTMKKSIRQHEIFKLVKSEGSSSIADIAEKLDVSTETVRRNVKRLVSEGLVVKVHGGIALPLHDREPPILKRLHHNVSAKKRIARAVAGLVEDGDNLIIDTGSTTAYIAQALMTRDDLTVITNSSYIANLLASNRSNHVFMTGGELRPHDAAAFGPSVIEFLRQFEAHRAILSMATVHETKGFMNYHLCEAEFSRAVMQQSEQVVVAADASKFGRSGLTRVCRLDEIDLLVTDEAPAEALGAALKSAEVEVVVSE